MRLQLNPPLVEEDRRITKLKEGSARFHSNSSSNETECSAINSDWGFIQVKVDRLAMTREHDVQLQVTRGWRI